MASPQLNEHGRGEGAPMNFQCVIFCYRAELYIQYSKQQSYQMEERGGFITEKTHVEGRIHDRYDRCGREDS